MIIVLFDYLKLAYYCSFYTFSFMSHVSCRSACLALTSLRWSLIMALQESIYQSSQKFQLLIKMLSCCIIPTDRDGPVL